MNQLPRASTDSVAQLFLMTQLIGRPAVPFALRDAYDRSMSRLEMDAIVEADEELMERYLEGEELLSDEVKAAVRKAAIDGSMIPTLCGSAFTDVTGVGSKQYIIKTVTSPWANDKVAMLVAGYEAADTANAVRKAMEGALSDVNSEQVYPIVSA